MQSQSVRLLTWKSSARIWCELHETAFRRLGGATRTVVLDNLKEGVLALPCRVRHPDRKGKVESGIGQHRTRAAGAVGRPVRATARRAHRRADARAPRAAARASPDARRRQTPSSTESVLARARAVGSNAGAVALSVGSPPYRFVRSYLMPSRTRR